MSTPDKTGTLAKVRELRADLGSMLNDVEAAIPEKRDEIQHYTRGGIVPTAEARDGINEKMDFVYSEGERALRVAFEQFTRPNEQDPTKEIDTTRVRTLNSLFDISNQSTAHVLAYLAKPAMDALIDDVLDNVEPDLPTRPERLDKLDQLGKDMQALIDERDALRDELEQAFGMIRASKPGISVTETSDGK